MKSEEVVPSPKSQKNEVLAPIMRDWLLKLTVAGAQTVLGILNSETTAGKSKSILKTARLQLLLLLVSE